MLVTDVVDMGTLKRGSYNERNGVNRTNRTTRLLNNKKMSPQVYSLRRKVIELIYEANKLIQLPRIEVRVCEPHLTIAGVARMGQRIIWINENYVASKAVVFHEILHAVYSVEHVNDCPLMGPVLSKTISDEQCNQLFLKYAKGA